MEFKRCYSCMGELPEDGAVCPRCGYDNTNGPTAQPSHVLPCGTILNGQFVVGRSLGQGGFGITYIGYDLNLELPVCIKEYYPEGAVSRSATQSRMVYWGTSKSSDHMKDNRRNFVKEAQKAVKLRDLNHVVSVWGVFFENETAYIVMDYVRGETLKSRLDKTRKTLSESECVKLLAPVMEDLDAAHKRGIIHRDIKPDNIMLRAETGEPVLLDMGAAKDLSGGSVQSSLVVASQGFSPVEQYRENGNIGPWTDVYAMSATVYYCITGKLLPPSIDRMFDETVDLHMVSPAFGRVLEKGLSIKTEDRIQSMGELLNSLWAALDAAPRPAPKLTPPMPPHKSETKADQEPVPETHTTIDPKRWYLIIAAAILAVMGAITFFSIRNLPKNEVNETPTVTAAQEMVTATPAATQSPVSTSLPTTPPEQLPSVGDTIVFGSYEQDNDAANGPEDIEWLVLSKEGGRVLVISRYALDCQVYNTDFKSVTWETCSLRKWLNDTFVNTAFSKEERTMIPRVTVSADNNLDYNVNAGNSTTDQVFLLSITDTDKYFNTDDARKCVPTAYAIAQGAGTNDSYKLDGKATCWWWLRSPGYKLSLASSVNYAGSVRSGGTDVNYGSRAVRPALWINLYD